MKGVLRVPHNISQLALVAAVLSCILSFFQENDSDNVTTIQIIITDLFSALCQLMNVLLLFCDAAKVIPIQWILWSIIRQNESEWISNFSKHFKTFDLFISILKTFTR
jgi:hypothetical protein